MNNFKLGNNSIIFTAIATDGSRMSMNTNRRIDVSDEVAIMESVEKVLNDMQKVLKYPSTWVGLTDREMMDAIDLDDTPMEMGRKIEQALKERNT
jgi:hypothetical protein